MKDLFYSWLNKCDRHGRSYGEYLIFALIIGGITLFYILVGPLL
jgi:hypothetical protein